MFYVLGVLLSLFSDGIFRHEMRSSGTEFLDVLKPCVCKQATVSYWATCFLISVCWNFVINACIICIILKYSSTGTLSYLLHNTHTYTQFVQLAHAYILCAGIALKRIVAISIKPHKWLTDVTPEMNIGELKSNDIFNNVSFIITFLYNSFKRTVWLRITTIFSLCSVQGLFFIFLVD